MPKRDLILLALDDSSTSQLFERALRAVSYETAIAKDKASLEMVLQENIPALLLVGEKFAGEAGLRVASDILDRFPTMPVVIYIERESPESVKEILRNGLSDFLSPPLRNDDIVGTVERCLQRARHLGDWVRHEVKRTTASLEKRAKITEDELKRYETIFANIQDGVIILDADGRIQFINKVIADAFEIDPGNVTGKIAAEVIQHPDMQSLFKRALVTPLKYHEVNFDDGRIFNAQYAPMPGVGFILTIQDISYLKQVERMKNEFVHTVSHDLRSPLTSVLGYTELVERVGPLNENQVEFLNRIRSSVESITSLVNDLLDLSRLEAGFDTRREVVHLENILKYALDTLEGQVALNGLTLETEISESIPEIRANPIRLRQLLDNLLGNAVKYTSQGGVIKVTLHAEGTQVILSVSDSGVGIPKAEQTRVFEKFYRATNVPDQTGGSGLGLAIVKSIVEAHQGRIWVESELGQGSRFYVVLPAVGAEKQSKG